MRNFPVLLISLMTAFFSQAQKGDVTKYPLDDSIKAVQLMAEFKIGFVGKKELELGISTDVVKLSIESNKKSKKIVFEYPKRAPVMASGLNTETDEKDEIEWKYNWNATDTYKLLISTTSDSAGNFSLYSGYVYLPSEKKWKFIGTCKINGSWNTIQSPTTFIDTKDNSTTVSVDQVWIQRNTGSWKNLRSAIEPDSLVTDHGVVTRPNPVINLFGHLDSAAQRDLDTRIIKVAIANGKTDVKENVDGVYYTIMKEGTGRQVSINDTVTAFYKGYLFANDSVFDQTKDKPAVFPLKRLIKGWQIGVPLVKVGGKIKLVIPSDLAYSVRTRAAKIPPNSILVFEIEVLDTKTP